MKGQNTVSGNFKYVNLGFGIPKHNVQDNNPTTVFTTILSNIGISNSLYDNIIYDKFYIKVTLKINKKFYMASAWHIFPCLNISIIGLIVLCLVTKLAANELSSLPILKPT